MAIIGTITDFDDAGLFGLILAEDGLFFPFNLRDTSPALRGQIEIGARVKFSTRASGPMMRAFDLVPLNAAEQPHVTERNGSGKER